MADRFAALVEAPVLVAPMAGGPSTPALLLAAGEAGAFGFLAAGYKRVADVKAELDAVRAGSRRPFGVNVFVPGSRHADRARVAAYVRSLSADAAALGAALGPAVWDDDHWEEKLDLLVREAPAAVSLTFGCPDPEVVRALQAAGSAVGVTVTSVAEAGEAVAAGADFLVAQGIEAGAHRGSFANDDRATTGAPLLRLLGDLADASVPVVAAGGVVDADGVAGALGCGASAVACGTAFLRCPESGANQTHKDALADPRYTVTALTRAFSGRPARGLVNRFVTAHPAAPPAYPEINNVTRPLRSAAADQGDSERLHLWAGTGFRQASELPAAEVVERLVPPA